MQNVVVALWALWWQLLAVGSSQPSGLTTPNLHGHEGQNLDWVDEAIARRIQDSPDVNEVDATISLKFDNPDNTWFRMLINEIDQRMARLDINFNLPISSLTSVDGLGLGFGAGFEIASAKQQEAWRMDRLNFNFGIDPGDFLSLLPSPLYIGLAESKEIIYIRKFDSFAESRDATPLQLKILPTTAARALEMPFGAYFVLPSHANFEISAAFASQIFSVLRGKISGSYLLSGDFVFQISRLPQERVRVKVISSKGNDCYVKGKIDLPFKLFKVGIINRITEDILEEFFDFDIVDLGYHQGQGSTLILDYVFDLADPDAAAAYDELMGNTSMLNLSKVLSSEFEGEKVLPVADLGRVEELSQAGKDAGKQVITRLFKGAIDSEVSDFKCGVSILVCGASLTEGSMRHNLTLTNFRNESSHFYMPMFNFNTKQSFGFKLFTSKAAQQNFALFQTDANFMPQERYSFGASYSQATRRAYRFQVQTLYNHLRSNFPRAVFAQIPWENIRFAPVAPQDHEHLQMLQTQETLDSFYQRHDLCNATEAVAAEENTLLEKLRQMGKSLAAKVSPDHRNFRANYQVLFKKAALRKLREETYESLEQKFATYKAAYTLHSMEDNVYEKILTPIYNMNLDSMFTALLGLFSAAAVDIGNDPELTAKYQALRLNPVYRKVGLGFIFYLLQDEALEEVAYISLAIDASDSQPINIEIGAVEEPNLYFELDYATMNSRSGNYHYNTFREDQRYLHRILLDLKQAYATSHEEL